MFTTDDKINEPNCAQQEASAETLTVAAANGNLHTVMAFVDDFLEKHDCPMKAQMQLDLCVEEIFVNIANYAYGSGSGDARICITYAEGTVTITFADGGVPYDPLAKPDPDITLSAEERQIGGLGVFLVKKNTDRVDYRYEDGKNILTLTKKIN